MNTGDTKDLLTPLRDNLRGVDDEIVRLVIRRMEIVREIGALKQKHGIEINDPAREASNLERNRKLCADKIPASFIDELSEILAKWSRWIQSQVR
jgi:chorismate mutase/prephenate dehydrogenase